MMCIRPSRIHGQSLGTCWTLLALPSGPSLVKVLVCSVHGAEQLWAFSDLPLLPPRLPDHITGNRPPVLPDISRCHKLLAPGYQNWHPRSKIEHRVDCTCNPYRENYHLTDVQTHRLIRKLLRRELWSTCNPSVGQEGFNI